MEKSMVIPVFKHKIITDNQYYMSYIICLKKS